MPPKQISDTSQLSTLPMALPAFLKMLTSSGLPMADSMAIASKIFKEYNTPAKLSQLTAVKLTSLKVEDKDQRTKVLTAIRKAGYKPGSETAPAPATVASSSNAKLSPRKRRRDDDLTEDYASAPRPKGVEFASLDFGEILDEGSLMSKSSVTNRAPVMAAWATVVAERLGFKREEALSIASVYTEMNATSKGVSLGIFDKEKQRESAVGSAQPFVTLLDRKIPVMRVENEEWRGVIRGQAVEPATAFGYIKRALRQTAPFVVGALRLLSLSFEPQELNRKGYGLYAEFRPKADGWGKKTEMHLADVLGLRSVAGRRIQETGEQPSGSRRVEEEAVVDALPMTEEGVEEPARKRPRGMTLEEYEDALDQHDDLDPTSLDDLETPR